MAGSSLTRRWNAAPRGLQAVRSFATDRRGAVALMFGLLLLPLTFAVGAALDFTKASTAKAQLDAAIDSAALSTVSKSYLGQPPNVARAAAIQTFNDIARNVPGVQLGSVDVRVDDTNAARTTTGTYAATITTAFIGIVGMRTLTLSGTSVASNTRAPYIDFHLLLDNSPSMGVAATVADIQRMQSLTANTPDGTCAFACHITGSTNDNYALAKANGVQMRIDVVRSATQQLLDTADTAAILPRQFRTAIFSFGESCTNPGLTTLSPLNASNNAARQAMTSLDLMAIPYQNYNNDQCSDFNTIMTAANQAVADPGQGASPSSPQKVVMIVSDGLADYYNASACTKPTTGGRCQEPMNPALCTAIKTRGIKIAVLYTTYLPIPDNGWYNQWIAPFQPSMSSIMQSCASPDLFFEVSPSQGIAEAMQALFRKAIAQARFTQ